MATYKTSDFEAALAKKGFRPDATDHFRYWFYIGDKKTHIVTRTSHSEKEYDEFLLSRRGKQMQLTKRELLDFIECRLSAEAYCQLLQDRGIVKIDAE